MCYVIRSAEGLEREKTRQENRRELAEIEQPRVFETTAEHIKPHAIGVMMMDKEDQQHPSSSEHGYD